MLNRICRSVDIEIEGRYLPADLVVLDMSDFDVILGVDWLVKYHAVIDCHDLAIKFSMSNGDQFVYKLEAQRPLTLPTYELWGRSAWSVAAMLVEGKEEANPTQIPVVCEYPDVFPEDLPGYRMAPTEIRELKTQLEDLQSKGFIRPSVSP